MKVYLTKKTQKNVHFVYFEVEGHILRFKEGKEGVTSAQRTMHCGTFEEAVNTVEDYVKQYESKGYKRDHIDSIVSPLVFDSAQWHYDGDFPSDLDQHQAYVHTGLYIGWLLLNDLMSDDFKNENQEGINKFFDKKITAPLFFNEYMDGLFESDQLNKMGLLFTKDYYNTDFTKSKYIEDLETYLAKNIPTLYHINDTWNNFEIIRKVIDDRFKEWTSGKRTW